MANSVLWFEVRGKDGSALRKFYSELFGWKISAGDPTSGFDYGLIEPGYGGLPGGIGSSPDRSSGHATFYVEVDDPTAILGRAEMLGGKLVMPETEIPSTRVKLAYFADPEGHVIGVSNGAAVGGRGDAGANPVLWFEVMGKDGTTLRNFYHELFGWKISQASAFDYWMIEATGEGVAGGIGIGRSVPGLGATHPDGGTGFATFKVEVDDPAATLAKAEELGGEKVMPVTDVPGTHMKIAYFADPEGHVIGLSRGLGFTS